MLLSGPYIPMKASGVGEGEPVRTQLPIVLTEFFCKLNEEQNRSLFFAKANDIKAAVCILVKSCLDDGEIVSIETACFVDRTEGCFS